MAAGEIEVGPVYELNKDPVVDERARCCRVVRKMLGYYRNDLDFADSEADKTKALIRCELCESIINALMNPDRK